MTFDLILGQGTGSTTAIFDLTFTVTSDWILGQCSGEHNIAVDLNFLVNFDPTSRTRYWEAHDRAIHDSGYSPFFARMR